MSSDDVIRDDSEFFMPMHGGQKVSSWPCDRGEVLEMPAFERTRRFRRDTLGLLMRQHLGPAPLLRVRGRQPGDLAAAQRPAMGLHVVPSR